jgi:NTP pyrophosphatase (non-canonical NTP hydrolase)
LSLASEAGEVLEIEKKKIRDGTQFEIVQKDKFSELGDVLWGVAVYAHRLGFTLEDVAKYNIRKIQARQENNEQE